MHVFTLTAKRLSMFALALVLASSLSFAQWSEVGQPIKNSISSCAHTYLNGKLYVFGGVIDGSTVSTAAFSLDVTTPGAAWKQLKNMPANRLNNVAAAANGKIYIMGGRTLNGSTLSYTNSVYEYDPATDTYTTKANMKTAVGFAAAASYGGKIFVLNGYTGSGFSSLAQVYDPATNTWALSNSTLVSNANAAATVIDSTLYLVGGEDGSGPMATVQVASISGKSLSWTSVADLPDARSGAGVGNYKGSVVVLGGVDNNSNMTSSVYVYDAKGDTWGAGYSFPTLTGYNGNMDGDGNMLYAFGSGNTQAFAYAETGEKRAIAKITATAVLDSLRPEEANSKYFTVQNLGVLPLSLDMSTPEKDTWLSLSLLQTNVPAGGSMQIEVSFDATGLKGGTYSSKIDMVTNDPNNKNISLPANLGVYEQTAKRRNLIEVFTSSTCPPCNPGNKQLASVLADFDEETYSVVKYQQYFPGTGDPYTTTETRNRGGFYGVNSIPNVQINGFGDINPNGMSGNDIANADAAISLMTMKVTSNIDLASKTVSVKVDLDPMYDHNSASNRLYVAVMEQLTKKNVKSNGETQFEHVVKKMLPNETGDLVGAIKAGSTTTKNYSYSFPGSYRLPQDGQPANVINLTKENSVEDFNNFEVVAWVQDAANHVVYNSARALVSSGVDIDMSNVYSLQLTDCVPNPVDNVASMKYYMPKGGQATIDLVDLTGNKVRTLFNGYRDNGESQLFVDASNLAAGFYQVVLKCNGSTVSKSFVVAR